MIIRPLLTEHPAAETGERIDPKIGIYTIHS